MTVSAGTIKGFGGAGAACFIAVEESGADPLDAPAAGADPAGADASGVVEVAG
jgi:hypothetical protein